MADLMAVGAYSGDAFTRASSKLGGARISVDLHALVLVVLAKGAFVGPDGFGRGTSLFAMTGKHDVHIIHIAVAVGVVILQADRLSGILHRLEEEGVRILVVALTVVLAIVGAVVGAGKRSDNVAMKLQLSV